MPTTTIETTAADVPTAEAVADTSGGLSVMTISLMVSAFVVTTCIVAAAAYYVLRKHPSDYNYNRGSSKTKHTASIKSAKSAQSEASTEEPPSTLKESRPPSIKSENSVYYDDIGSDGNQGSSTDL